MRFSMKDTPFALDRMQQDHRAGMRARRRGDGAMIMTVDVDRPWHRSLRMRRAEIVHRSDLARACRSPAAR